MIKTITINNFGPYKESSIDLSPTFTAIMGAPNEGKSHIVKAIEWVRTNRPLGDKFVHTGAKNTSVSVITDNGTVRRFKGKTGNGYQINDDEPSTAIKTDIPEEVFDILKLDDLNIQNQFDSHYLVFDSAGAVGKTLNKIINLEQATEVLDNIRSKIRKNNADLKIVLAAKENLEDRLDEFDDFSEVVELHDVFVEGNEKYEKLGATLCNMTLLIDKYDDLLKQEMDIDFDNIEDQIEDINSIFNQYENKKVEIKSNIDEYDSLVSCIEKYNMLFESPTIELGETVKIIDSAEKIHISIEECVNKLDDCEKRLQALEHIETSFDELFEFIEEKQSQIDTIMDEYVTVKKDVKECPLCETTLTKDKKKKVLENLS